MTIYASEASALLLQLALGAARTMTLAAFAGLLMAAFRVKAPHIRLFAWIAVLYAGLGMPVLGGMLPSVRVPLPFATTAAPTKVANENNTVAAGPVRPLIMQASAPTTAPRTSL